MTKTEVKNYYPLGSFVEKIGGNCFKINDGKKGVVRFYNTEIITVEDGKIKLDSNGGRTNTTKKWINLFLNDYGYNVYQKNYNGFVLNKLTGEKLEFIDGMIL